MSAPRDARRAKRRVAKDGFERSDETSSRRRNASARDDVVENRYSDSEIGSSTKVRFCARTSTPRISRHVARRVVARVVVLSRVDTPPLDAGCVSRGANERVIAVSPEPEEKVRQEHEKADEEDDETARHHEPNELCRAMIQKARTVSTISHGTPRGSTRHSWRRARARKGQRHASERDEGESRRAAETRVRCASGRLNTGHGSRAFGHRKTHPKREGEGSREDPENPHERVPTAPARRVESRVGPLVVVVVVVVVVDRAVAASGTSRAPSGGYAVQGHHGDAGAVRGASFLAEFGGDDLESEWLQSMPPLIRRQNARGASCMIVA